MIRSFGKFSRQPLQVDPETGFKFYPIANEDGEDFHLDIAKSQSTYEGSVFVEALFPYYASVEAGGRIRVASGEPSRVSPEDGEWFIASDEELSEGGYYDPEANELYVPEIEPVIPTVVSKAQAKLALLDKGLLDDVEAALAAMDGVEGQRARIEWNDRTEFHRSHEFIGLLAAAIGLSDANVDELFAHAASL